MSEEFLSELGNRRSKAPLWMSALVFEFYGMRLSADQVAQAIGTREKIRQKREGGADCFDVALHIHEAIQKARAMIASGKPLFPKPPPDMRERWQCMVVQTPSWANLDAIRDIYRQCREVTRRTGVPHHVDHIVPIKGRLVLGLHVENNLRIIPATENIRKRNRFEVQ